MEKDVILTIKERMFLKKLDKIIQLLEEIYGKMCGENPEITPIRNMKQLGLDDDIPF